MIVDAKTLVAGTIGSDNAYTAQEMKGTDTTVLSDYSIDLGVARDAGEGTPLYMRVQVETAASGGTSVEFQIVGATAATLASGLVVLGSSGAIAVGSVTAGSRFYVPVPPKVGSLGLRYLGARAATVGAVSAGKYFIDFVHDVQDGKKYYGSGFAVL